MLEAAIPQVSIAALNPGRGLAHLCAESEKTRVPMLTAERG